MINQQVQNFLVKLKDAVESGTLIKLVISNQRDHASDLQRIIITMVELKKGIRVNFVYRYLTRDITKNHDISETLEIIGKVLEKEFYNADLFTSVEYIQLIGSKRGKSRIRIHEPVLKQAVSFSHDRIKDRIISTTGNIYLRELGVISSGWEIRHEMADKYVQINKYIELLAPEIRELSLSANFHVADMGSGKGYLTFALYDYLSKNQNLEFTMTGVESREDLVNASAEIAKKAGFANLNFITGTIKDVIQEKIDVLIALHACDTATDDAIYKGITAGSVLIVCSPCCHKQLRGEFHVTSALRSVLKHGILKEREAEIITDGIRALIMESYGYKTRIFEFISTEHTPKNLMITGRKISGHRADNKKILEDIRKIKELFGIKRHYLEELLDGLSVQAP